MKPASWPWPRRCASGWRRPAWAVRFEDVPGYGVLLHADVAGPDGDGPAEGAPIYLMGHMDTVFPAGTVARRPFRVEEGRAYGPGVADMKSGLVLNVFVAEAFARCGGLKAPLKLFFSCDEEIGSPATRQTIMDTVRGARAVFNAEPGRVSGNLVTSRKGSMAVEFEVQGRGRPCGHQPRGRRQRAGGHGAQAAGPACADRSRHGHDHQCGRAAGRHRAEHGGAPRQGRARCALHGPDRSRCADGAHPRHRGGRIRAPHPGPRHRRAPHPAHGAHA